MSRRYITLCYPDWAVHLVRAALIQAVEVSACALVAELANVSTAPVMGAPEVTWLWTLKITLSPLVKFSNGKGHCPLIPMTERSAMPSGLALTQPMFQS